MSTQADITEAVNWVLRFADQQIAFPNGQYLGECTAPVVQMLTHLNYPIPYMANNRADGWGVSPPVELKPFYNTQVYQSGVAYPEGTLMMWDSPHIAVIISCDGSNNVKVFEQNADPNGSNCHIINRVVNNEYHHANYVMIPIIDNTPPPLPYTKENIIPKQIVFNKDTHLWNLSLSTFDQVAANPTGDVVANPNDPITVDGILHPTDPSLSQYSYYTNVEPFGYNVLDCDDYVRPPVAPPQTTLQNFPPVTVKPAQKYTLVTTVPTYDSVGYAATGVNPSGTFPAGDYYVYDYQNDLYLLNITNTALLASCKWVNSKDNVPPPPPEPLPETPVITNAGEADEVWKMTYKPFNPGNAPVTIPVLYNIALTYTVVDLDNKKPNLTITKGRTIDIYGTFTKDGVTYYRPRLKTDTNFDNWYAIPLFDTYVGQAILTKPTPPKKKPVTLLDRVYEVRELLKEDEVRFLDIIPHWFRRK